MIRFFGNLLKEKVLPFAHVTKLIKSIDESFPWKPKVPSRVAYFVWTVALGNILTVDNIWKQEILILDCYCMCKRNGELVDHLLIHCALASDLWFMIFILFGIHWAMPKMVMELLACWKGKSGRHRNGAIWMVVLCCLMWCIWRERNNSHLLIFFCTGLLS